MSYFKQRRKPLEVTRSYRVVSMFAVISIATMAMPAEAEEPSLLTEQTEDFFSDQSRVGSIVGGILAGAAFANPFAPLGGTIIGFIVGKSTDFSEQAESESDYYARRSFAPAGAEGAPVETLALSVDGAGLGSAAAEGAGAIAGLALAGAGGSEDTDDEPPELAMTSEGSLEPAEQGKSETPEVAESGISPEPEKKPLVNLIISKDVGGRQAELDRLAAIIRQERDNSPFEANQQCLNQKASRFRKKVVVAGFNLENPDQAVFGGLGEVGHAVNDAIYQNFQRAGEVLPLAAPGRQMFASLRAGSTRAGRGNRLEKYSAVSRQMGAQFVVSGIIRSVEINKAESWDSSYASSIKRSLFSANTTRQFVVDVVLHDGYTGQVVSENRYTGTGRWDIPRTGRAGFGSPEFRESGYGVAVTEVLEEITEDVMSSIDCQAMLVPILEVTGKDLLLDVGTRSGLLPGDKLRLVRAESSLQRPDAPPKLWDTGVDLHLHQLSLDTSRAWMPSHGSTINIREGDYAVIY